MAQEKDLFPRPSDSKAYLLLTTNCLPINSLGNPLFLRAPKKRLENCMNVRDARRDERQLENYDFLSFYSCHSMSRVG